MSDETVSSWLRERRGVSPCFTDDDIEMLWSRIKELEAELKWLQREHVRVCSSESNLREAAKAVVDANNVNRKGAWIATIQALEQAIDALAALLTTTGDKNE